MKSFDADKLKQLRKDRGLKLQDVATPTGLTVSQLSNFENGHAKPPADKLLTLLDFYKVTNFEVQKNVAKL